MMRVALGATSLLSPLTGIGQYTRQLALALQGRPDVEPELFLGTRWGRDVPPPAPTASGGWLGALRRVPGMYELRRLVQVQRFRAGPATDLYHEPNILPLPYDGPTVLTVHDLSWIRHPESHPASRVRAFNRRFEAGLRQASLVLTDAQFVREEVISEFGFPPERIRAIPLGVEALFKPLDSRATATSFPGADWYTDAICWPWARWSLARTCSPPCAPTRACLPRFARAIRWWWWA